MERRTFLGALTATSLGVLFEGSFTEFAGAQKIPAPLWTRAGHSDGARLSPHKPDVAFSRAAACRESHRDLRGPARVRAQRDTRFYE